MHRDEIESTLAAPGAAHHHGATGAPVLVGNSRAVRALRRAIAKMAATDEPVLITGETGTGKQLAALLLHHQSARGNAELFTVNCPALPPERFQVEVCGGLVRKSSANAGNAVADGTLFLDEVADLAPESQSLLLRTIDDNRRHSHARPRIVAATHTDLARACREGQFREDLYFRLKALHLHVPPLRERGEDILLLAEHFLDGYCTRLGLPEHRLDPTALDLLNQHPWPGNVRELRHQILQALLMCEGNVIGRRELELSLVSAGTDTAAISSKADTDPLPSLRESREKAERAAINQALRAFEGDVCTAARNLDISRAQLYRLIKRLGIDNRTH